MEGKASFPQIPTISAEQRVKNVEQVNEMKDDIADRAQLIINDVMPTKILQLNNLFKLTSSNDIKTKITPDVLQSSIFTLEDLMNVHYDLNIPEDSNSTTEANGPDAKKRKLDGDSSSATVPCNKTIVALLRILKMEILQLIEYCNTVKIWIQLNIPRIEDGNNFGVSIQEETVNELSRAEDSGFTVLESITKYFVMRAKLVSKVLKYPTIEDYRTSIDELDEKEYINLRLCTQDLRNNYAILHDMITKNMEKIKKPRTNNNVTMVY